MKPIILDDTLRAKLNGLSETIPLQDADGKTVGHFVPAAEYQRILIAWAESQCPPFTQEELERFNKEPVGKTLSEFWHEMGVR